MMARWARPVNVARLTKEEAMRLEADEAERAALAEALELIGLDSLTADISVRPWRGEGVRVMGTVRASLRQECVVTLEPVETTVEETFDVRLHPDVVESETVEVDPEAPDPPERMTSDMVDVGALALEHFVLGIDPYPRAPGVAFEQPVEEDAEPSPFAALASLKGNGN
jgi:uncharacterized metal-binding protein YceD (DUF177 family)